MEIRCGGRIATIGETYMRYWMLLPLIVVLLARADDAYPSVAAYWRFEEGAGQLTEDSSGNANHGTLVGDCLFSTFIPVDPIPETGDPNAYSIQLDGSYDAVVIPDSPSLRPTDGLTIEAWIRAEPGAWVVIGKQLGSGWSNSYAIELNQNHGGYLRFVISDSLGMEHDAWDWTAPFPLYEWHHIAATWDLATMVLYVDGDTVATAPYVGSIGYDSHPVLIGADDDGLGTPGACFFKGNIDEVRITDRAISSGVSIDESIPAAFALRQNRPNPFSLKTSVAFDLSVGCAVSLKVFDAQGRQVRTLADQIYPAGRQSVVWSGDDEAGNAVGSGIYFVRIEAGDFRATGKMLLAR